MASSPTVPAPEAASLSAIARPLRASPLGCVAVTLAGLGLALSVAAKEPGNPLPGPPASSVSGPAAAGSAAEAAAREPACAELTNGCEVCRRASDGRGVKCSTPGIACQPSGWACKLGSGPAAPSGAPKSGR
jgi:hypothetical protein